MVIDGEGRPADHRSLCGQALKREEVIGTPLAANAFALFDAIWLQDPRIEELRESRDMNGRVAS
jgi:predicted outer membrane lipoprotein